MPAPTSEDDLKRRARRRLIGAVALTLAAVIVLPLLLEDEPPPAGQLEVHMPPVAELPKTVDAPPVAPAPPIAPSVTAQNEPPTPKAEADKPDPTPAPSPQPEPKTRTATNATEKTESKSSPVDTPKPATEKPVAAFVVQLGAFSHADKTVELKNRVDDLGLHSYTDRSGALTRLRVGPFSSREAAVEAAARLAENGVQGQVMPK